MFAKILIFLCFAGAGIDIFQGIAGNDQIDLILEGWEVLPALATLILLLRGGK